ncbi:MAG TPA: phosphotransferase [Nitrospiraceae bacterium]|nr:phosphotransferase [Nitrospiraceae bacterium]
MDSWPARLIQYLEREGRQALAEYLPRQRWFGAKGRQIVSMRLLDHAVLAGTPRPTVLVIMAVEFSEGRTEQYFVPLLMMPQGEAGQAPPSDLLCTLPDSTAQKVLVGDATADADACLKLVDGIRDGLQWRGCRGTFRCMPTLAAGSSALSEPLQHAKRLSGEQSNTSVVFDRRVILKLIRKFDIGINPDREILEFLTTRTHYRSVPLLIGTIEYHGSFDTHDSSDRSATVGLLQTFIPNDGDGWSAVLKQITTLLQDSHTHNTHQTTDADLCEFVQQSSQHDVAAMGRLGAITAELHTALSSDSTDPAFRPEQISQHDVSNWRAGMASHIRTVFTQLRALDRNRRADLQLTEDDLASLESGCERQLDALRLLLDDAVTKIRVHGDYHLGQVLKTGQEFIVLDFEGEPARRLEERRAKQCALKDVAGMLRSFNYAACAARRQLHAKAEDEAITALWEQAVTDAFWTGYTANAIPGRAPFMPGTQAGAEHVLRVFELDKTIYEIGYELNNRPDWLDIPLQGLRRIVRRSA